MIGRGQVQPHLVASACVDIGLHGYNLVLAKACTLLDIVVLGGLAEQY